jgi:hypothetical protein
MARKVGLVHSLVESSKKGIRHIVTMELESGAICIGYPPPRPGSFTQVKQSGQQAEPRPYGGTTGRGYQGPRAEAGDVGTIRAQLRGSRVRSLKSEFGSKLIGLADYSLSSKARSCSRSSASSSRII